MPASETVVDPVEVVETLPDPVSPESPAPAETQQAADDALAPDAETAPPSEDRARGPDGKFIGPDADPGSDPAPAVTEPTIADYPSFTYRADGQELPYDGAVQDDEGNVLFTPQAVKQLQQDLAYARAYPRRDAEAQRDLSREKTARQSAETTMQSVLGKLEQMFEASQGATTWEEFAQTPFGQWIANRHSEWPKLKAEGIQKGFDLRSKQLEAEIQSRDHRDQEAQQRPVMLSRVEEAVKTWGKEAGLTEAEQQRLIRRYQADGALDVIFPRAKQDDPVRGLRAGQRFENLDVIRRELLDYYEMLKGRTPVQAAASVAAENDRRTGKAGQKAPPTPGVGRGSKPAAEKSKTYTNTREADRDIWG